VAVSDETAHMPALLGAAFALLLIILGSSAARIGAKFLGSRRRRRVVDPPLPNHEGPPIRRAEDAPDLVPRMPGDADTSRNAHLSRAPVPARTTPRAEPDGSPDETEPSRAGARELEENVRALLRRLQHDLQAQPRATAATVPSPRSAVEELDEVLAKWRARKRGAGTA
jgi:hypothetical protein